MQPFLASAALRRGEFTRRSLARECRPIYRDVYLGRDVELTAQLRARCAWLATGSPLCGLSAAALWGTRWLSPADPAEVLRSNRRAPTGLIARSYQVADDEMGMVAGIPVTTPARTAFDIGRRLPGIEQAIPLLDAVSAATRVSAADIAAIIDRYPGQPGVDRLRRMLALIDGGAESPKESRLRLLLVRGGLPVPETQIAFPELRIRVDMGWREWKVAVEYDGVQHWADGRQRAWDIERIALLEAAGWVVVRVSAAMLARPDVIVERVRAKLRAAGCPV